MLYQKPIALGILLLLAICVSAQNNSMVGKTGNPLLFEKIYLHTDKDIYASGDTLWFKAYLVNAQDNKPSASSNNLYVDLIGADAKVTRSEIIRLDNGLGQGDFDLPDSLVSGTYRLRAYTNWMRNFGDNFIFEKQFTVLEDKVAGAVEKAARKKVAAAAEVKNKNGITASATATATSTLNTATAIIPTATIPLINFFPEGGSMVNGISSFVGVKAENGRPANGAVISSLGDTVSRFSCDSSGMGMFVLLPLKGQYYRAVMKGVSYPLPAALNSGLALQVRHTDTLIRLLVSRSDTAFKKAVLKVKHAGVTLLSQQLDLTAPQMVIRIPDAGLPEGIAAITLYDDNNKPNCERLVYIHQSKITEKLSINTNKQAYRPKERVTVNINAPYNANLSMAVVDAGLVPEQADDIVSYLRLQSEVRGSIEHARRYFDTTNTNRFKQLDLLLMTQGWRDFVWRRLADTAIRISYAAENGVAVSGKVEDEVNHKPMPNLFITLRADSNKGNKLFGGNTDAAGRFAITGLTFYGKQSVNLTSSSQTARTGSFVMDTLNRLPVGPIIKKPALKEDTIIAAFLQKRTSDLQMSKLKRVTHLKEVKVSSHSIPKLSNGSILSNWGPNELFNITSKDYQYKTLSWYLLQNSKGARPSTDLDTYGVVYAGLDTMTLRDGSIIVKYRLIPPQIFVNDRELTMRDHVTAETYRQYYFNLPIEKFKTIELKHMVGALHTFKRPDQNDPNFQTRFIDTGLIDFYLLYLTMIDNYTGDNLGYKTLDIEGYYQARAFYQPPPNAKPQLADYRTTICWEPNIKTDDAGKATVSYYNTVPSANVRVIVQGITNSGTPVAQSISYEIK